MTQKNAKATIGALIVFVLALALMSLFNAGRRGSGDLTFGDLVFGTGFATAVAISAFRFFAKSE